MNSYLPVFISFLLMFALGALFAHGWSVLAQRRARAWPQSFRLIARPIFTTEERLLYRELKAALPQHVVLAKINLLRFCQSASEAQAQVWFKRLQSVQVGFVICTPNGAVISAIDIDTPNRGGPTGNQRLKEAVLAACGVRYARCASGQWPKPELLAPWALGEHVRAAGAVPATSNPASLNQAREEVAQKLRRRRVERAHRFQDSVFATDSFFADDTRFDFAANSAPMPLESTQQIRSGLRPVVTAR